MISLNLAASGRYQTLIKDYLEQNASETLADKINNGVIIEKDGKKVLSVKTLDGFMSFALEEARKLADKGAKGTCVEDNVVYGWAIHYFEEESIIEKLYLEDGTEYKAVVPKVTKKKVEVLKEAAKSSKKSEVTNGQQTMFDMFDIVEETETDEEICDVATDDTEEEITPIIEVKPISPLYTSFKEYQESFGENTIILMRVGDFYEVFGEWAKKVSEHLDLTLVGRDLGLPERVPMVGIPYHRLDVYIPKMRKISSVAVCQNDVPAQYLPMINSIDYDTVDKSTGEILNTKLKPEQADCLRILRDLLKEDLEVSL